MWMWNGKRLIVSLLAAALAGCSMPGVAAPTATIASSNTPEPTQTFVPTFALEPSATATATTVFTPTVMPTIEPMIAVANTSVTFRSEPRKGGDNVGGVYGNEKVKVIARNIPATWLYILAPEVPGGHAWVLAAAFSLQGDLTRLPIAIFPEGSKIPVLVPPLVYEVNGTPLPLNPPVPGAVTATILQQARVRVGPGLGYMEVGVVEAGSVVVLTGHIRRDEWYQIEYPSGLEGKGWVAGELVKFDGDPNVLPFYNPMATLVTGEDDSVAPPAATDTPGGAVETPTPEATVTPALPYGITLAQINARSGPASSFASYGLIEKDQPVTILGQTVNGLWYQIQYPAAPNGVAWVAAEYVRAVKSIKGLPVFDNQGNPLP
jgi:uncharacterized protein YraI